MAKRSNESECWRFFDKPVAAKAKCKLCDKILASVGGSTSGLMTHLRAVHPDVRNPPAQQQRSLLNYGVGALRPCCDSRQEQITGLVSEMLVANMLPVALVESPEFRALLSFFGAGVQAAMPADYDFTTANDGRKASLCHPRDNAD